MTKVKLTGESRVGVLGGRDLDQAGEAVAGAGGGLAAGPDGVEVGFGVGELAGGAGGLIGAGEGHGGPVEVVVEGVGGPAVAVGVGEAGAEGVDLRDVGGQVGGVVLEGPVVAVDGHGDLVGLLPEAGGGGAALGVGEEEIAAGVGAEEVGVVAGEGLRCAGWGVLGAGLGAEKCGEGGEETKDGREAEGSSRGHGAGTMMPDSHCFVQWARAICFRTAGVCVLVGLCGARRGSLWRRDRDSNPGYLAVYTLSKRAPSATRPSLRGVAGATF
jgi:hypothetical protein